LSLWGSNPRLHRAIPVRHRSHPCTWVYDQWMTDMTTRQLSRRGRSQLDRLSKVCWLRYPGNAGVQVGRSNTSVQLGRFDTRPDGRCLTGSVDVAAGDSGRVDAGASAVWNSPLEMPTRLAISSGNSLTCPTDASADRGLVGTHNVCGYARVPVVPGGPGLPQPSSVASPPVTCSQRGTVPVISPRLPCSGCPLGSGYPTAPTGTPPTTPTSACPASR